MLDVFNGDAFTMVSLTESINKLPAKPGRIGRMGLFTPKGITTTTAVFEEQAGQLFLIPAAPRGTAGRVFGKNRRTARTIAVPHLPFDTEVLADDVIGKRVFGSEDQEAVAASEVTDKLQIARDSHDATLEYLMAGALQGVVYDAESSTALANLFTIFNIAETTVDFLLSTSTTQILAKCIEVKRLIEKALGAAADGVKVHCLAGSDWFTRFTNHPAVQYAYAFYQEGTQLRTDARSGFEFGGIMFEEYAVEVGGKPFIPPGTARFFPVGVPRLFGVAYAPADFMEAVGTLGIPYYAKQEPMPFNRGINIHTQSNPLPYCCRPAVLIKGTGT